MELFEVSQKFRDFIFLSTFILNLNCNSSYSISGELNEDKNAYEVKIKKEHAASMDSENKATLEPITSETANNTSKNPDVIVEKSGGCTSR